MKECKHERVVAYTEDGARYHACRDCPALFPLGPADMFGNDLTKTDSFGTPVGQPTPQTGESTGVEGDRSDPWKAVHRIKRNHEAVINAAITVVNCAEWQGEDAQKFLAEAIAELKSTLGSLPYTKVDRRV